MWVVFFLIIVILIPLLWEQLNFQCVKVSSICSVKSRLKENISPNFIARKPTTCLVGILFEEDKLENCNAINWLFTSVKYTLIFLCTTKKKLPTLKRNFNKECGGAMLSSQVGLSKFFKVLYLRCT